MILPRLSLGLGSLLLASFVGNILQYNLLQSQKEATEKAEGVAALNGERAELCATSVSNLKLAAEAAKVAATAARETASQRNRQAQRDAQDLLSKPASVPGDSCASARVQIDDWLGDRAARGGS